MEEDIKFADKILGSPQGRYRIVFGLGSTVDTVTFDVGWHGARDDERATSIAEEQAKAIEPLLLSGTGNVVFLSCEYLCEPEEPEQDLGGGGDRA